MSGSQFFGSSDNNTISVLGNETVSTLLRGWVNDLTEEDKVKFMPSVEKLEDEIRLISPQDVGTMNFSVGMIEISTLVLKYFGERKNTIVDSFFNTLNMCVVGLGTKLRNAIHE